MKKLLRALICATMVFTIVGCGGSDDKKETKKEYVKESEFTSVYTTPDKYKGKYIKLTGKVFNNVEEKDGKFAFQIFEDIDNYENSTIIFCKKDPKIAANDYIEVDGKIMGEVEGENAFGATLTALQVEAVSVKKSDYKSIKSPTLQEVIPDGAAITQHGITLEINKIEFAKKETRVYLKLTNASADKFSFYQFTTKAVQGTTQYDIQPNYEAKYPEISSDIMTGVTSEGVLVFPAMEHASLKIIASGMSDNYNLDFSDFVFDIAI